MKKIVLFLCFFIILLAVPLPVYGQFGGWATECYETVCLIGKSLEECPEDQIAKIATIKGFDCVVRNILNIAIRLAGVLLFIMLIVGGFKYLTAGGDPKKAEAAQKTLTYAIAGLVLVILAWFILLFIEKFTGVDVTQFNIPTP